MPRLKILQVVTSFGIGGAEQVAFSIARHLSQRHDMTVFAVSSPAEKYRGLADENKSALRMAGVHCIESRGRGRLSVSSRSSLELMRHLLVGKPDIVHSHTDIPDFCTSLATRLIRLRLVRTIHNTELWPTHPWLGWIAESGFTSDDVVSIGSDTHKAYRDLRVRLRLKASPYHHLVPNGVDIIEVSEKATSQLILKSSAEQMPVLNVGFVGRLESQKGVDLLVDAIRLMPHDLRKRLRCHLIGDGSLRRAIEADVAKDDLPVQLYGAQPNANRWMPLFDLMVIPSRYEGAPLVAMEAQVTRTPAIFADAPGLREVIPEGWPLVMRAGDASHLSSLLGQCVAEDSEISRLAARYSSGTLFSAEAMASQYEEIYKNAARRISIGGFV